LSPHLLAYLRHGAALVEEMVRLCRAPLDEVVTRLTAAVERSEPSALAVVGGSPKCRSAFADEATTRARCLGFEVMEVAAQDSDRWRPHAALISLLSPRLESVGTLPDAQAAALRVVLAMETPAVPPTPMAVQTATLSMLGQMSEHHPVLLLIREGQWVDESSARAIAFAVGRLVAEPVVTVVTIAGANPDAFRDLDVVVLGASEGGSSFAARDASGDSDAETIVDTARAFETEARRARGQGALHEAAHAWSEAARLSAAPELAASRLFESATDLWMAGSLDLAVARYDEASDRAVGHPDLQARISLLAGQAIGWHRSPSEAVGCLHTAAAHARDMSTATACMSHAAVFSSLSGDVTLALQLATKAQARAPVDDPVASLLSAVVCGWHMLLAGDARAPEHLATAIALAPCVAATGGPEALTLAQLAGLALVIMERWDEAVPLLQTVHSRARSAGWQAASALSAAALALVKWRRGAWDAAYVTAVAGVEDAVSGAVAHAWSVSFLARICAGMGHEEQTRQLAGSALEVGEKAGAAMVSFAALAALGHLELSLGRLDAALEHLDALAARVSATGLAEVGFLWWELDHLEALALAQRTTELSLAIERFVTLATPAGRRWATGVAAHARAMSEPGPQSERWWDEAIRSYEELGVRFERARALLRRGQARLARRNTVGGRHDLEEAKADFDRLGAVLWSRAAASWCRRRRGAPATSRPVDRLTQAELRVALAASAGKKNREIAAELYLSTKTVDYHLQSIYRTLHIRSRTELALLLHGQFT
jgi:DNA-binding CsgD family transcriptional regulator